jgi:hypothetical protein
MRTFLTIALFCLSCGLQTFAAGTEPTNTASVTFYYPRVANAVKTILTYGAYRDFQLTVFSDASHTKLITLQPGTFVTVQLPAGSYLFRAKLGIHTTHSLPITLVSGKSVFLRAKTPQTRKELPFQAVACRMAKEEGARLDPLKARDIYIPMMQVIDSGTYFHAHCAE